MAWSKPKVQLYMKTFMRVTIEEVDLEGNVLTSVTVIVPRQATSSEVELSLQAKLNQQKLEMDKILALEMKLASITVTREI